MDPRLQDLSMAFLADRHQLLAFIRGLVRDRAVAEDVFQDVWLRLADAVDKDVAIRDLAAWTRGVARNLVLRHWRDQRRARSVIDSDLVELVERAFVEQADADDRLQARSEALRRCVERLPEAQRRVLALKYGQSCTVDAIAERLAKSSASVLMMLSRVRRALAACAERTLKRGDSAIEGRA